ncbi:hypothetical protein AJ80_05130 [Polytolypa hystricis UAMH7299]|uniref:adenosine deaminase n=1 Tax=Polytolypa hystricis (strain UAMH7299) TaxID=1447883 RepID=A0A2B7Y6V5_POLH7|nr:hypothetical protein AJ80_05130 [Polytolypa hystricis UAMH7299]
MENSAPVFVPEDGSESVAKYLQTRQALVLEEKQHRSDDEFRRTLTPLGQKACAIVSRLREEERKAVWSKSNNENLLDGETELYPGMMFMLAKERMESTKLWRIATKMPKGALLHAHMGALVDLDWLFRQTLAMEGMCFYASQPLLDEKSRQNASVRFKFSKSPPPLGSPSIWSPEYVPETLIPAKVAADTFPDGGREGILAWLKDRTSIVASESIEHHLGVDAIWRKLNDAFAILASIIYHEPILRPFVRKFLSALAEDGVRWVELRDAFASPFRREGQEVPDEDYNEMIRIIGEEIERFKDTEEGKGFWGARIIWTALRHLPSEAIIKSMEHCISAKRAYPHLIAGFDLVGQEDLGKPHKDLISELLWFRQRCTEEGLEIPFFFHAGECLGDGDSTDGNLFDAVLLGTRRIGHGFSLYKHPTLIEMVKERKILIESCPISNEVLRLTSTILAHPLPSLLARGVSASLSNDDPALLGQGTSGMSHDFWSALQAWENLGLAGLGSLAENSVRWAIYEDQTDDEWRRDIEDGYLGSGIRAARMKEWRASWEEFCQWIVNEFGS